MASEFFALLLKTTLQSQINCIYLTDDMHDMYWMGVLCGHFLAMYWADVSHETTPCLVCWIPANIAEWSTLQL